ncbi:hypothetical protein CONCODRAFT_6723 [Conidiobolus coronatus NRRL 28638]|uniref:Sjogrens syndrome scleroderma autoantigen 1 n=1 Tax=Conidiobolus coronatus (strain ATCC 28846 / CBS 209.66 / NRRL 28638) TaxID=796925 RepID=A0A137P6L7_CONC2|nr:hypothetical protein CONCODRAFT_6723 [Conidiobolus coronatus NRRL 28638]|eukprot:KXN70646.1 hypothetical protein CONCODRAFT_6723 [Conidiobolus coronatus NRRL 28638]
MEQASNILSGALLSGMTMTDKECKTCQSPLMRPRNSKLSHCVVCEELKATQAEEVTETNNLPQATTLESQIPAKHSNTSEEDHFAKKSRASELIGRKMLQGYTMLQEYCQNPSCIPVPLVRNSKDMISSCVLCDTQYLRESDFSSELHGKMNLVNSSQVESEAKTAPQPSTEQIKIEHTQKSAPIEEPIISTTLPIPAANNYSTNASNIKVELESTITQKLIEFNNMLKLSQNLQETQDLLKCIELAINTLNTLKRN